MNPLIETIQTLGLEVDVVAPDRCSWQGGWIRGMLLPDGRLLIGTVCDGSKDAAAAVQRLREVER